MQQPAPRALLENTGLVFVGERVSRNSSIPDKLAERMLGTGNPHGKPNADVLRRLVSAAHPHRLAVHWQIDFPDTMGEREAALYEHPFRHLLRTLHPDRPGWWLNPHANARLRAALARGERYLATPVGAEPPAFAWFGSAVIPDDSLLAVARDDDWTHGVLLSRPFALWWHEFHSRRFPRRATDTFPFPWPPGTPLSVLTAAQEEQRHAIVRAARVGEPGLITPLVEAAYGWPASLPGEEVLARLLALNQGRAA